MTRREELKTQMSGGTTAPAGRKRGRRQQIRAALAPSRPGNNAGMVDAEPARARSGGTPAGIVGAAMHQLPGGGPAVAGNADAGIGAQLSHRVQSGAIDQEQAERVAKERAELEKAYGPDWRRQVYGDRGYVKRTRKALAANPTDPQLLALYQQLMQRRKGMLQHAGEMG